MDFLRGIAALLVCVSHLSAFLFVPLKQVDSPGILIKAFYFFATLGHPAVLLFFILSGYLVGGSVIRGFQLQRWSWRDYLLRRITRLWVVLFPALLLTLFWDSLGKHLNPAGYMGDFHRVYGSGPELGQPVDLGGISFMGNLLFLQTICVQVYGSNSPLWSIANEFWYYLLFPLFLSVLLIRGVMQKTTSMLVVIAILLLLPKLIIFQGLSWLMGAGIFFAQQRKVVHDLCNHPLFLCGGILFPVIVLLMIRFGILWIFFDYLIPCSFVPLIAACSVRTGHQGVYSRCSVAASEVSYTLYLVHFPILAFLFFSYLPGRQMALGFLTGSLFCAVLGGVLLYSVAIWWLFERNTDRVRTVIERSLSFIK